MIGVGHREPVKVWLQHICAPLHPAVCCVHFACSLSFSNLRIDRLRCPSLVLWALVWPSGRCSLSRVRSRVSFRVLALTLLAVALLLSRALLLSSPQNECTGPCPCTLRRPRLHCVLPLNLLLPAVVLFVIRPLPFAVICSSDFVFVPLVGSPACPAYHWFPFCPPACVRQCLSIRFFLKV